MKFSTVSHGLLASLLACSAAQAAEPVATPAHDADRGYSYFLGLARQEARYQEMPSIVPAKTTVRTSSPLLITGALFPLTPDFLMSVHSETTFFPGRSREEWIATASSVSINGVDTPITDPVLQTNGYSLSQSTNQLLAHHRIQRDLFGTAGVTLRSQSFKRYDFVAGRDNLVNLPTNSTIEESSSEVLLNAGLEFESERVRNRGNHHGLRAMVGVPLWRRLNNTAEPQVQFDGIKGFDLSVEGRYSWAVFGAAHLGLWGKYTSSHRNGEVRQSGLRTVELPKSRLDTLGMGVEFLWKL
jgi:hypothetical protein